MRRDEVRAYIIASSTPEPNSGCWLWNLRIDLEGYGRTKKHEKFAYTAHRVSFWAFKGNPGKKFVCHRCDTRACVNPDHLVAATHKENMRQMVERGRQRGPYDKGSFEYDTSGLRGTKTKYGWQATRKNKYLGVFKTHQDATDAYHKEVLIEWLNKQQ